MPRKLPIDISVLTSLMISYKSEILNSDGNLNPPSSKCWDSIAKKLDNLVSNKYVYTMVKMNRYNLAEKLGLTLTQNLVQEHAINNFENYESNSYSSSSDTNENVLSFNITLSKEEWSSIYDDRDVLYKRSDKKNTVRSYNILKPNNWTPLIHEHFVEQTRLPCNMVYKRAKVYLGGNVYLDMSGHCTICKSNFKGVVFKTPEANSRVIISCSLCGEFKDCRSGKKRKLIGETRNTIASQMIENCKSASFVHREMAKNSMVFGEKEPSNLPTANALRVLKCKTLKQDLQNDDPILSLIIMKGLSPYNQILHDIGYDRFFVHYWSTTEINLYRTYAKSTNTPTISIDATGGFVRKPTLMSGRITSNIFLYEISVMDHKNGCQYSVAHMLSERHDNNSIGYWLFEWLRSGIPVPKVVVTDQSLALMMGVVKTFSQFSTLSKYLQACSLLVFKKSSEIPNCMVRNDFNHIMHIFSSWFDKKTSKRIKNFYMRSFGLLVTSTNFEDTKLLLRHIFTVSLSEADGLKINGEETDCEIAKNYLKHRIATGNISNGVDSLDVDENDFVKNNECQKTTAITEEEFELLQTHDIYETIQDMYKDCLDESFKSGHVGDHDNMQYDQSIAKKLANFCKLLPCWSSLMVPFFNYGNVTESSSPSESLFKDLKSVILKHKTIPIRIDEFIKIHATSIIGSNNIIKSKYNKYQNNSRENSSVVSVCSLENLDQYENENKILDVHIENWKGLGEPSQKKKPTYLDPDPTIMNYDENSRTKSHVIGILRNGNCSDLLPINIDGLHYTMSNTCSFDSVFQLMCSTYVDDQEYKGFLNSQAEKHLFFELVAHALRDGINAQTYKKRGLILCNIHKNKINQITNKLYSIDCATTSSFTVSKLLENWPTYEEVFKCNGCKHFYRRGIPYVLANLPTDNIEFLEDVVNNIINIHTVKCPVCGSGENIVKTIGNHMFIETVPPFSKNKKTFCDLTISLESIPKQLHINEKTYVLRGVIAFIPPVSTDVNAIGHYVNFCWRTHNHSWEKYDDMAKTCKLIRKNTVVHCQFLLYT